MYDVKRAVIEKLLNPSVTFDEGFAKTYKERRIDIFNKPEIGVTQEAYAELYKNRDISIFMGKILPTPLLTSVLGIILDFDQLVGKPINLGTITHHVNIYPYELDDDLANSLTESLSAVLPYTHDIVLVKVPPKELVPSYFRKFDHVFKYDLLGENSEEFCKSLPTNPIKDVKFHIPDLFMKEPGNDLQGSPKDVILKMSVVLAPFITLIPISHAVYDYKE